MHSPEPSMSEDLDRAEQDRDREQAQPAVEARETAATGQHSADIQPPCSESSSQSTAMCQAAGHSFRLKDYSARTGTFSHGESCWRICAAFGKKGCLREHSLSRFGVKTQRDRTARKILIKYGYIFTQGVSSSTLNGR